MIESPCTGVCEIDTSVAFCRGCGRSLDEIADWSVVDDPRRRAILAALPDRLAQLKDLPCG